MRIRLTLALALVFLFSCGDQTGTGPGDQDAASKDARLGEDAAGDVPPPQKDVEPDGLGPDRADLAGDVREAPAVEADAVDGDAAGKDAGTAELGPEAAADGLRGERGAVDSGAEGRAEVAAVDAVGGEAGLCQTVVPPQKGDTVGVMASQCNWTSSLGSEAPAAGIALPEAAEAMSFRVHVQIDAEAYAHQGYVSMPSLGEMGPLSMQGMEVTGPVVGTDQGQYFFDLRWANEVAPREGMKITLTASFSFACSPEMSRTIVATTTAELLLCRSGAGPLVWRAPGETCDICDPGSPASPSA